jgi:hypothetical protein
MALTTVTSICKLKEGKELDSAKFREAVKHLSMEKGVVKQYWVCATITEESRR